MKQRLLTGTCYVLVLLGFYFAKAFLPAPWGTLAFDGLLYAFSLVGAFEMLRALGNRVNAPDKTVAFLFAALFIPAYDLFAYLAGVEGFAVMGAAFFLAAVALFVLLVGFYQTTDLENVACALLACAYPTLLLGALVLCNHLKAYSDLAVLFVFVISPCADSLAFVFGVLLGKKFPQKMSPHISPKKTWVGGVGGVFGGVVGAIALFFIYNALTVGSFDYAQLPFYVLIGAGASVCTEFGDLVESAIKRKVGIKDMGKILPGHGGVLDRIDGSIFAAIFVYAAMYIASVLA